MFKSFIAASLLGASTAIKIETAAKCPFGHTASENLAQVEESQYVSDIFDLTGAVEVTTSFTGADYDDVAEAVLAAYEAVEEGHVGIGSDHSEWKNERGRMVACLLRTAGHDFMDFKHDAEAGEQGGSDGCINLEDEDNKGLQSCLTKFGLPAVFDQVKDRVSFADFLVIAGEAAAAAAATNPEELALTFKNGFKYGRRTVKECEWNVGRMPNPEHGCQGVEAEGKKGLRQIFVENIYRGRPDGWALTAAISGAHTVGKVSRENSGYEGHWSTPEQQGKFNNDFYAGVVMRGWMPEPKMFGNPGKNQWKLSDFGKGQPIMNLNTDLCMFYTKNEG